MYKPVTNLKETKEKSQLTPAEEEKITETFKLFDKDNNGYIDEEELSNILEMLGQKPTEEDVKAMLSEIGAEVDRRISLETFLKMMAEQKTHYMLEDDYDIMQAFVALGGEPDGKGNISKKKLVEVVEKEFGLQIDIEKLLQVIDKDDNKDIDYEEFKSLLSSQ